MQPRLRWGVSTIVALQTAYTGKATLPHAFTCTCEDADHPCHLHEQEVGTTACGCWGFAL